MLISQPAFAYLEAAWRQLCGTAPEPATAAAGTDRTGGAEPPPVAASDWWARSWETAAKPPADDPVATVAAPPDLAESSPLAVATNPVEGGRAADRPSAVERRARAAAFRALLLARQRRHGEAAAAFAEALALDPTLDLTESPAFWDLERAAHYAAADAYEAVGRTRDAMTLRGRVELRFRPRLLRPA